MPTPIFQHHRDWRLRCHPSLARKRALRRPPLIRTAPRSSQDAAFNPSTFGEPLDAVFRLQERTYLMQRLEAFRVPGDSDTVAALMMRLDRGSDTLEGVDDPHVPASLLKLWLRELIDPLVPWEMYNDCIAFAGDAEACCATLFLNERVLAANKMTSANLTLVMAPNLLRCGSDPMAVVFNNAQHNLLLHLICGDAHYVP
ncbi:Rho GTPase activation protein [Lactarius deliciosus]|nr:Rho GTPase activation protein [Lactarius deliciosus]